MKWDPKLCVGCEIIDNQHKELVQLVDELESSSVDGISPQQLGKSLKFIVNYSKPRVSR